MNGRLPIRINEGSTDLSSNGVNVHECMLVSPDGHFHLERRWQQLPSTTAKLMVFESALTPAQLRELEQILSGDRLKQLPAFGQPPLPMSVPWFQLFSVTLPGEPDVTLGYVGWRGGYSRFA